MEEREMHEEEEVVTCPDCERIWNPDSGMSYEEWLESSNHCFPVF